MIYPMDGAAPFLDFGAHVCEGAILGAQPRATAANRRPVKKWRAGRIGIDSVIGHHAVIYAGVMLGRDCRVGDHATIREGCRVGNRCVIGTGADIQYEVDIADDVRILNQTQIAGGSRIGAGTFIGPGVQTANDPRVNLDDYQDNPDRKGVTIGEKVFIGVGAILLPGVVIGDRARIAAGAVVVKDVAAGESVFGVPAMTRLARGIASLAGVEPSLSQQQGAERHLFEGR